MRLDALHAGEVLLLVVVGCLDPFHVGLGGQATDELHVLAGAARALPDVLHDVDAVGGVVECLDVHGNVLDAGRLVRNHLDALCARLFEDGGEGLGRVGDDGDGDRLLRDQILDDLDLLFRRNVGSTLRSRIVSVLGAPFLDAHVHAIKPCDALDLDDGDHRLAGIARGRAGV